MGHLYKSNKLNVCCLRQILVQTITVGLHFLTVSTIQHSLVSQINKCSEDPILRTHILIDILE